eukprot:722323-Ditylum_brightwellii.AAC.1
MDNLPINEEIYKAINQLNNTVAGASGIRAEISKFLVTEEQTFAIMKKIVHKFWTNKQQPTKFDI